MRTCPITVDNKEDNSLLKNDFFEFSRYSGYILQVRWTKAKLLASKFFRILCTKSNQTGSFLTQLFKKNRVAFFDTQCTYIFIPITSLAAEHGEHAYNFQNCDK